jgi:hypothetical protein
MIYHHSREINFSEERVIFEFLTILISSVLNSEDHVYRHFGTKFWEKSKENISEIEFHDVFNCFYFLY